MECGATDLCGRTIPAGCWCIEPIWRGLRCSCIRRACASARRKRLSLKASRQGHDRCCEDSDVCSLGGRSYCKVRLIYGRCATAVSTAEGKSDPQSSPRNHCALWRGTRQTLDWVTIHMAILAEARCKAIPIRDWVDTRPRVRRKDNSYCQKSKLCRRQ
jgi:hypothetical protein